MGFDITYRTVTELNCWHHFWLDTATDDLVLPLSGAAAGVVQRILGHDLREILFIRPTPDSQELLASRGLIFKQTTTGCFLANKNTYSEPDDGFRVSFALSLIDPNWLDYTDIEINNDLDALNRRIFHLSNFGEAPAANLLLTDGGNNSLRAEHFVQRKGRVVRLRQQTPGTATTIEVFDALSASATPVLTFDLPAIPDQEEYELDCRSLPEGLYNFVSSNNNIDTTVDDNPIYLGLENLPGVIGVVDLFIAGWEESTFDIRLAKF